MLARICISLVLTHILTVFYASSFQWSDLSKMFEWNSLLGTYYTKNVMVGKAVACFICILCSVLGRISTLLGSTMSVLVAVPQLYRSKGALGQRVRVVLGPLSPILAVNNLVWCPDNPLTVASAAVSFLAFVVFRPDNTAVLQCFGMDRGVTSKYRRRIHGILAACNTVLAALVMVSTCGLAQSRMIESLSPNNHIQMISFEAFTNGNEAAIMST
jgi:hypothetical protein